MPPLLICSWHLPPVAIQHLCRMIARRRFQRQRPVLQRRRHRVHLSLPSSTTVTGRVIWKVCSRYVRYTRVGHQLIVVVGYVQCDQEPAGFAAPQFANINLILNAYHPPPQSQLTCAAGSSYNAQAWQHSRHPVYSWHAKRGQSVQQQQQRRRTGKPCPKLRDIRSRGPCMIAFPFKRS